MEHHNSYLQTVFGFFGITDVRFVRANRVLNGILPIGLMFSSFVPLFWFAGWLADRLGTPMGLLSRRAMSRSLLNA